MKRFQAYKLLLYFPDHWYYAFYQLMLCELGYLSILVVSVCIISGSSWVDLNNVNCYLVVKALLNMENLLQVVERNRN
jgi:hypothetical protein